MSHTGYLIIDHRASPGIPGMPKVVEHDTLWCAHCSTVFVKNPDRFRPRGHCSKGDHYLCDVCAVAYRQNGICRPWSQVVEDVKSGKTPIPVLARNIG